MARDEIGRHYYAPLEQASADVFSAIQSLELVGLDLSKKDANDLQVARRYLIKANKILNRVEKRHFPEGDMA